MFQETISRRALRVFAVVATFACAAVSAASAQTADASPATVEAHQHLATAYDEAALGHLRALYHHVMARHESRSAAEALLLVEQMQAIATALRFARQHQDSADAAMTSQQRATYRVRIDEIRVAYADAMREQRLLEAEATRRAPNLSVLAERVRAEHGAVMRASEAQAQLRRSLGIPNARPVPATAPIEAIAVEPSAVGADARASMASPSRAR